MATTSITAAAIASVRQWYVDQPSATSFVTCFTAPANTSNVPSPNATATLGALAVCNTTSSTATITVCLVPSGGTAGAANALAYQLPVNAYDTKIFSGLGQQLPAGATVQATQGTSGAVTVILSGAVIQ